MKSKYLEHIEEAYRQFNLFTVKEKVDNGDYLVLFRNVNENYDISELVTNDGNFADTIFDRWREGIRLFKEANNKGRYIVIMLLKQNDNYQLINDYRMWGINISNHKPDKYYSRKHIDEFVDLLIKEGYIETNK